MITIIIPVYNLASYIEEALDSIRAQSYGDWEAIVVEDCSRDESAAVVCAYIESKGDSRIRFLQMEANSGVSAVRNAGAAEARGEWLAFLDGDDYYEDSFLETMLSKAEGVESCVIHCDARQVDAQGSPIGFYGPYWFDRIRALRGLFTRNYVLPSMMICSRAVWEKVGPFDEDPRIQHVEDWDWVLRALELGVPFQHVPRTLTHWRRHLSSATHQPYRQYGRARFLIRKHAQNPLFAPYVRRARIAILRDFAWGVGQTNPQRAVVLYRRAIRLQPFYLPAYLRLWQFK